MNKEIILGLLRHTLTGLGGVLVTRGVIDQVGLESIVGALLTIVGVFWSVKSKTSN